jgi:hypothetical protein
MTQAGGAALVAMLLAAIAGCRQSAAGEPAPDGILAQREARLEQALGGADSVASDAPVARWLLPARLKEISGLALTADDRLFTHGDELGRIVEVDYRRGVIVKEFSVGSPVIRGDFEALTVVRDTLVLLTSDGILYRFVEGADHAVVPYTRLDTELGDLCEFEGMAFEPSSNILLLACKQVHDKALKGSLVIVRWSLGPEAASGEGLWSPLAIPLADIIGTHAWDQFEPADMAIHPVTGNYLLVASRQKGLVEVSASGAVVSARSLPPGHEQAEGVAITRDDLLVISDEAKGVPAMITVYRLSRGGADR